MPVGEGYLHYLLALRNGMTFNYFSLIYYGYGVVFKDIQLGEPVCGTSLLRR